jgi:uncharacterized protein YfkK (UPF0435 family)
MERKLFTEKQINLSTFLGGPITSGILICKNYMALEKARSAYFTILLTILFTVIFFYGMFQIPEAILDKIPNLVFSAFYALVASIVYRFLLREEVDQAFENGADKHSNWTVTGATILGFLLNVGIIFLLTFNQPYYQCDFVEVDGNELYYEQSEVSLKSVEILSKELVNVGFFESDSRNIAKLEKLDDAYQITMLINEEHWIDKELMNNLVNFKLFMKVVLGETTFLELESVSLSGVTKHKHL